MGKMSQWPEVPECCCSQHPKGSWTSPMKRAATDNAFLPVSYSFDAKPPVHRGGKDGAPRQGGAGAEPDNAFFPKCSSWPSAATEGLRPLTQWIRTMADSKFKIQDSRGKPGGDDDSFKIQDSRCKDARSAHINENIIENHELARAGCQARRLSAQLKELAANGRISALPGGQAFSRRGPPDLRPSTGNPGRWDGCRPPGRHHGTVRASPYLR